MVANPAQVEAKIGSQPGPYLVATKIPRCPRCWEADGVITANPLGLSHCPRCAVAAPPQETTVVRAKITGVTGAIIAFGFWMRDIGAMLRRWAGEKN